MRQRPFSCDKAGVFRFSGKLGLARDAVMRILRALLIAVVAMQPANAQTATQRPEMPGFLEGQGLDNPPLGMGLNGISDWSTQHPFIDIMKTARPWIGHLPGQWGGVEAAELEVAGVLDAAGWPKSIPQNVEKLEALILTDQPASAVSLAGRYRLTYEGTGTISLSGRAQNVTRDDTTLWFDYTPGEGAVGIVISGTDPNKAGDHIRNISVVRAADIPLFEVGAQFNPNWLRHIDDLRLVRFMDWMLTNDSPIKRWQDRPSPLDYTYGRRGVPVEAMVALANQIGADPWFNMPHQADDDYVRQFAGYVRDNLSPTLKAHVEYSNEVWNFIFSQAGWAQAEAAKRWGDAVTDDGWIQFAGLRAAQVAQVWSGVYGDAADGRLVRVIGTHSGWPGLERVMLQAPLWMAENPAPESPPLAYFDAYAVTGYFGYEVGGEPMAPEVLGWISESMTEATAQTKALALEGEVRAAYLAASKYILADQKLADYLSTRAIPQMVQDVFAYQAKVARTYGFDLIMYEGGSHITGTGDWTNNQDLTAFLTHFSYSPAMAQLYHQALSGWRQQGGTVFTGFVDVAAASKWGSWGALRHLDDKNPRNDALRSFNAQTPAWWGEREAGSFTNGLVERGTNGNDQLGGTRKADVLIGLEGDDVLLALGDGDRLNGGPGNDIAVLPGVVEDYSFYHQNGLLVADGPQGRVFLYSIETVRFVP